MAIYEIVLFLIGCAAVGWNVAGLVRRVIERSARLASERRHRVTWSLATDERLGDLYVGVAREIIEMSGHGLPTLTRDAIRQQTFVLTELEWRAAERRAKV